MSLSDQSTNSSAKNITGDQTHGGDESITLTKKGKKMGRPRKAEHEKYKSTHIKLHPKIVEWAKNEAKKRGIGYQSVINETLLEHVG